MVLMAVAVPGRVAGSMASCRSLQPHDLPSALSSYPCEGGTRARYSHSAQGQLRLALKSRAWALGQGTWAGLQSSPTHAQPAEQSRVASASDEHVPGLGTRWGPTGVETVPMPTGAAAWRGCGACLSCKDMVLLGLLCPGPLGSRRPRERYTPPGGPARCTDSPGGRHAGPVRASGARHVELWPSSQLTSGNHPAPSPCPAWLGPTGWPG